MFTACHLPAYLAEGSLNVGVSRNEYSHKGRPTKLPTTWVETLLHGEAQERDELCDSVKCASVFCRFFFAESVSRKSKRFSRLAASPKFGSRVADAISVFGVHPELFFPRDEIWKAISVSELIL